MASRAARTPAPEPVRVVALRRLAGLGRRAGVSAAQAEAAGVSREQVGPGDRRGVYEADEVRERARLHSLLTRMDAGTQAGAADVEAVKVVLGAAAIPGVGDLAGLAPGPGLAGLLSRLAAPSEAGSPPVSGSPSGGGLRALSEFSLVEVAAATERLTSWAAAVQAEALAILAARQVVPTLPAGVVSSSLSPENLAGRLVAARLRLAPATGGRRVHEACRLAGDLPATLASLKAGRISPRSARIIAEESAGLDASTTARLEQRILPRAERLSPSKLRAAIAATIGRLDPQGSEDRHATAVARRTVFAAALPDGMAEVCAMLPAPDAAALMIAVDAAAVAMRVADPSDGRTMDQRRADALASVGWTALRTGQFGGCHGGGHEAGCPADGQRLAGRRGGRPVSVAVTVAMTTLLGLDDMPAELVGYGPVPASVARKLAADGTWRRLLTDPVSGAALDYGTTRYAPPADLVELVQIRDRTCRWPGCSQPAHRCQVDHTIPAGQGGPTSFDDLGALCLPCHLVRTHAHWRLEQPEPGRFEWTDPTGHRYTVDLDPVGPIPDHPDEHRGLPPPGRTEPDLSDPPPF